MGRTSSKRGAVLQIRRSPDKMVLVAAQQIFQAIVKSNGGTDGTAALQLFAHLDGEALNVVLLMPEGERANWESLRKAFQIITIPRGGWQCSGGSLRAQLADLEWIRQRLPRKS